MQLSFLSIVKTIHLLLGRRSPFSSTDHGESQMEAGLCGGGQMDFVHCA